MADEPHDPQATLHGDELDRPTLSRDVTAVDLHSLLHAFASHQEASKHPTRSKLSTPTKSSPDTPIHEGLPYLPESSPPSKEKGFPDEHVHSPTVPATTALLEDENDGWTYPEGGRGWLVVLGCFIIAALTLGWPLAWGVFQSYYKEHLFPDASNAVLSTLGSIPGMLMNPISFCVGKYADRYGYRIFLIAGCVCGVLTMLTAAFCTQLWQLFLTQGLLQAITNGLILSIAMSAPSQWFLRRRGFATGIVIAGCSFGGGAASLIVQQLLTRLGFRKTLLIYTGVHAVLLGCAILMIRDRPHPRSARFTHAPIVWWDPAFFRQPLFWSVATSIFFTVFGFMGPYFYIEQYTLSQLPLLDPSLLALPAALMNFSAFLGRCLIGLLADKVGVLNAFIVSAVLSALVQLLVWNFAHTLPAILAFSILVGGFGAASISLIGPLGAKLFGARNLATVSGILMMFNMPGQAAGPPLLGALLQGSGGWVGPICFSGGCCVLGAIAMVPARVWKEKRVWAVY